MKDNWDVVNGGDTSDEVCSSDGTGDRGALILVCNSFSAEICRTALGHL